MRLFLILLSLVCSVKMLALPEAAHEQEPPPEQADKPFVVTTSWWITEWVSIVGGEHIDVSGLVDEQGDLHAYTPTPSDMRAIHAADIIFANGLGMEPWLRGYSGKTVYLGEQVLGNRNRQRLPNRDLDHQLEYKDNFVDEHGHAVHLEHDHHNHDTVDPHVWLSPVKAAGMVRIISQTLARRAPDNADAVHDNSDDYRMLLSRLDQEISAKMHTIPTDRRILLTGHDSFGYFAERYGFGTSGSIIEGADSHAATPSARTMMKIIRRIRNEAIPCIFEDAHIQTGAAENIAKEARVPLYRLHTATAVEDADEGELYIQTMRHNTETIVEGLAP